MSRGIGVVGVPVARIAERTTDPGFGMWPKITDVSATTVVTASATPHAVGAWTEMIAASTVEANWVIVSIANVAAGGVDTRALLDIGFGAAASEVLKISSLGAGSLMVAPSVGPVATYAIPLLAPKGTRVAARLRALVVSETADVTVRLAVGGTGRGPTAVDTYGADTAASRGTNMPTTDTYVELTAATTQAYRALIFYPTGGTTTAVSNETSIYTFAVGASGAEVVLGTMRVQQSNNEQIGMADGFPAIFAGHYPKGIRIAAKQSVGRTYRDAIVLGVPYA